MGETEKPWRTASTRCNDMPAQSVLSFMLPESNWVAPDLGSLPDWGDARRVAFDVETKDEDLPALGPGVRRAGNYICGYSFAIEDGPAFYIPLRHGGGGNVDLHHGLGYLREQAAKFKGDICGAGLQYDLDWAASEDIHFKSARFFRDVQIAAPLVDELQNSYSLESIAQRAGLGGKDEQLLRDALSSYGYRDPHAKRGLHALPAKYVGPYGETDARLPLAALEALERQLEEQDLWGIYDLESRVLPVLVKMRRRGVRVSFERLEAVERFSREEQGKALAAVRSETGITLDPADMNRAEPLARVLRSIGVEPPKTRKGKPSITAELLAAIKHPVADNLRWAREMDKLRGTFCGSVRRFANFAADGDARIHCTFNQLRKSKDEDDVDGDEDDTEGAAYGRLSCTKPNLQQQPSPDRRPKYGAMWRSIYLPERDAIWGALDYKQQEPIMAIHIALKAGKAGYISRDAYESAQRTALKWAQDKKADFHSLMTEFVYGSDVKERSAKDEYKKLRNFCKQIFLGLSYGMGGAKLCDKLGLPTVMKEIKGRMMRAAGPEGQAIIDKFNEQVPFVRQTAWAVSQRAAKVGYITTLLGRRCRFPRDADGNFDWTHKAFNRLDQGSSADQTKSALVDLDNAGYYVQLQVHDEIDGSFANDNEAHAAAGIMETTVPTEVPFRVDVETGESWGKAA